jgi:hypothetical protein
MRVVINGCFGGFGLSPEATLQLYEMGAPITATPVDEYWPPAERAEQRERFKTICYEAQLEGWREHLNHPDKDKRRSLFLTVFSPDEKFVLNASDISRHDPMLIQVIEQMGSNANGACSSLKIVNIPDDVEYEISEYDGNEHIAEKHRTWY